MAMAQPTPQFTLTLCITFAVDLLVTLCTADLADADVEFPPLSGDARSGACLGFDNLRLPDFVVAADDMFNFCRESKGVLFDSHGNLKMVQQYRHRVKL